jgi:hypothetical protein
MKLLIAFLMLISPVLAQDNSSPLIFDDGPIVFVNDPIPDGPYVDHEILPIVLNPGGIIKALAPGDLSIQNDAWTINMLAWKGNDSANITSTSRNGSLFWA